MNTIVARAAVLGRAVAMLKAAFPIPSPFAGDGTGLGLGTRPGPGPAADADRFGPGPAYGIPDARGMYAGPDVHTPLPSLPPGPQPDPVAELGRGWGPGTPTTSGIDLSPAVAPPPRPAGAAPVAGSGLGWSPGGDVFSSPTPAARPVARPAAPTNLLAGGRTRPAAAPARVVVPGYQSRPVAVPRKPSRYVIDPVASSSFYAGTQRFVPRADRAGPAAAPANPLAVSAARPPAGPAWAPPPAPPAPTWARAAPPAYQPPAYQPPAGSNAARAAAYAARDPDPGRTLLPGGGSEYGPMGGFLDPTYTRQVGNMIAASRPPAPPAADLKGMADRGDTAGLQKFLDIPRPGALGATLNAIRPPAAPAPVKPPTAPAAVKPPAPASGIKPVQPVRSGG